MFDVFEYAYMHLPCISEGACAIIAAEQSYTKSVKKKRRILQRMWSQMFPGSSIPHVHYCENKYGHFISMAAWAPMCWNVRLLRRVSPHPPPRLDGHPRHICVWGYTAQLQKEILTLKSLFKWSHSMRRALHRLRKSRNTVKRERVVRTDCL